MTGSKCQVHHGCGCGDAGLGFSLSRDPAGLGNGGVPAGGVRTPHPHGVPSRTLLAPGLCRAGQAMKSRWAWEQRPAASPGSRLVTVQGSRWPNSFRTVMGQPSPRPREGQGASEGAPQGLATPAPESHPAQASVFPGFFPLLFWASSLSFSVCRMDADTAPTAEEGSETKELCGIWGAGDDPPRAHPVKEGHSGLSCEEEVGPGPGELAQPWCQGAGRGASQLGGAGLGRGFPPCRPPWRALCPPRV